MAQKREKEETELKVPESLSICTPPIATPDDHTSSSARSPSECPDLKIPKLVDRKLKSTRSAGIKRRDVTRCSGCRRKVGLMGFRCRCGELFCSEHRYSDRHDCSFDYKAAGRETIARENPMVRAAKILKV